MGEDQTCSRMSAVMCLLLVFVLCFFNCALCLERGKPCKRGEVVGVCKSVLECPYAIKLIREDEKRPPLCGYEGSLSIVCCPTEDIFYRTGIFEKYFVASNHGVLRSRDMTCRYEGKQPFLCCQNIQEVPEPPDPKQCPALPKPSLKTPVQHFLWAKCLEYQRYFNKCIEVNDYSHRYKRVNTCPSSGFRISGGSPAEPKEFPHMAVIGCHNTVATDQEDIIWIGGGTLISDKYILTAAHVLVDNRFGRARYGLLGTLTKDVKEGFLVNIVRTIPHKNYVSDEKIHDIALVEIHERVKFNEFIRPACLPVPGREIEKERVIAGWGETDERGKASDVLLTAIVHEEPYLCLKKFEKSDYNPDTMICARGNVGSHGSQDACKGDSGGPLMAPFSNLNCSYSIEGVVSFGPRCGQAAGVYTRVTKYLDWIAENVWPDEFKVYQQMT